MRSRRQPDESFLRRLEERRRAASKPVVEPIVESEAVITQDETESILQRRKRWGNYIFRGLEVIGLLFLIPTAYVLIIDLEDRKQQRIAQAWETVTRPAPGNSGKGPALEYLNSQGIALVGIDLSTETNRGEAFLPTVDLSGANLNGANLSGANLVEANLSGANLNRANLSGANLAAANLSGAKLFEAELLNTNLARANLSGANLGKANLSDVIIWTTDFSGVNFSGVDLSGEVVFKQRHFKNACGNDKTKLAEGLTIKTCSHTLGQ